MFFRCKDLIILVMMQDFLEFEMPIYDGDEWSAYEQKIAEGMEKSISLGVPFYAEEVDPPAKYDSRIKIKPVNIAHYIESFSMESKIDNPSNPTLDSVDVVMESGDSFKFNCTYEEFEDKLFKFFTNAPKKRATRKPTEK